MFHPFRFSAIVPALLIAFGALLSPSLGMAAQELDGVLDPSIEAIVDQANKERAENLALREQTLADRETRLSRMRADLEQLISRNEALRAELVSRQEAIDLANKQKITKLVKMYEAMAPEEAAPILEKMEEQVTLSVFSRMKDKKAAGIMEFMPKQKAARLGEKLAKPN